MSRRNIASSYDNLIIEGGFHMKRMETNFEYLLPRVKDALDNTNLDYTRQ